MSPFCRLLVILAFVMALINPRPGLQKRARGDGTPCNRGAHQARGRRLHENPRRHFPDGVVGRRRGGPRNDQVRRAQGRGDPHPRLLHQDHRGDAGRVEQAANTFQLDESDNRLLIDAQLRAAGWRPPKNVHPAPLEKPLLTLRPCANQNQSRRASRSTQPEAASKHRGHP